ncbi:uncharacterized protein LOC127600289 isoform X2 [Hippocampus zosterae]|uniref:uncharacterized protein LOC127600289 isoform X2 n=1 Tax=Hippocampus zosterae TaxID=109293 RepID=UPI00223CCB96|nr:uncharacterized protein LOC127600289 isoform X2 [Hippocampus zosterae]XP_051920719.1 uncharacterized protein LOC127600289 isoform X2 [Hippocampus zosterae]
MNNRCLGDIRPRMITQAHKEPSCACNHSFNLCQVELVFTTVLLVKSSPPSPRIMGCSSSSAQNVDQEKKPGTKPEESNGGPLAVRNGIIAETIENKTQLCESALADDLQQAADDGTGAAVVVTQGQEDLRSGQDLMTELEPQPDPFSVQEPGSAAGPVEASSDCGFADVAVEAVGPQMVKSLSVEEIPTMGESVMEQAEVHSIEDSETCKTEVPVLKDDDVIKGEVPATKEIHAESPTTDIEPVRADVPAVVELASVVPAWASPEAANTVAEPLGANMQEAVPEVPDEVVPFLETASESSLSPPALVIPESPASTGSAPNEVEPPAGATAGDASVEDSTTAKSPEAKEAIIDTGIAVATIPEMPPLARLGDETQDEQRPTAEESNESIVMPSEIAQQSEPSSPTESTALQEPALVAQEQVLEIPVSSRLLLETSSKEASEFSSTFGASPSSVTSDAAQPTEVEMEANSPVTAADQASETSTEGIN